MYYIVRGVYGEVGGRVMAIYLIRTVKCKARFFFFFHFQICRNSLAEHWEKKIEWLGFENFVFKTCESNQSTET